MATYSMDPTTVDGIASDMRSVVQNKVIQAMQELKAVAGRFYAQNAGQAADGYQGRQVELQKVCDELVAAHNNGVGALLDIAAGTTNTDVRGAALLGG